MNCSTFYLNFSLSSQKYGLGSGKIYSESRAQRRYF